MNWIPPPPLAGQASRITSLAGMKGELPPVLFILLKEASRHIRAIPLVDHAHINQNNIV